MDIPQSSLFRERYYYNTLDTYEKFLTTSEVTINQACIDYNVNRSDIHIIYEQNPNVGYAGLAHSHNWTITLNYYSIYLIEHKLKFTIYHEFAHLHYGHGSVERITIIKNTLRFLFIYFMTIALLQGKIINSWYIPGKSINYCCWIMALAYIIHLGIYVRGSGPKQENEANALACDKLIQSDEYSSIASQLVGLKANEYAGKTYGWERPLPKNEYQAMIDHLQQVHNVGANYYSGECYSSRYIEVSLYKGRMLMDSYSGYYSCS